MDHPKKKMSGSYLYWGLLNGAHRYTHTAPCNTLVGLDCMVTKSISVGFQCTCSSFTVPWSYVHATLCLVHKMFLPRPSTPHHSWGVLVLQPFSFSSPLPWSRFSPLQVMCQGCNLFRQDELICFHSCSLSNHRNDLVNLIGIIQPVTSWTL